MPRVSREQMRLNREAVVRAAAELIREKGVAAATVDAVTARAGLTHGGFYKQFGSKQALVAEAVRAAAEERQAVIREGRADHDSDRDGSRGGILGDWYLSAEHRDNPAAGCPVAALVGDAAVDTDETFRAAYRAAVDDLLAAVEAGGSADPYGDVALMVGAIELSRATAGTPMSDRFLESARRRLHDSAGAGGTPRADPRPDQQHDDRTDDRPDDPGRLQESL
jgi:TetR/AcrR family transcriptional regulator, transcriptional repressor for nem operon